MKSSGTTADHVSNAFLIAFLQVDDCKRRVSFCFLRYLIVWQIRRIAEYRVCEAIFFPFKNVVCKRIARRFEQRENCRCSKKPTSRTAERSDVVNAATRLRHLFSRPYVKNAGRLNAGKFLKIAAKRRRRRSSLLSADAARRHSCSRAHRIAVLSFD